VRRSVLEAVAACPTGTVKDIFWRHAAPNRDAFAGGSWGRWGRDFPVIYLARSESGAVIEAYRHLVEEAGVPAHMVKPRTLYTVQVEVGGLLDLTSTSSLDEVGLTQADLTSPVDDYEACQEVAAAAHQLGRHGILAPAAHGLGQTLALFRQKVTPSELPVPIREAPWEHLPPDPRLSRTRLRSVGDTRSPA
jgi:RES domain-containing protein